MSKGVVVNVYTHYCKVCFTRFTSTSRHSEFCSVECSNFERENRNRRYRRNRTLEPILKICREVEAYNKAHGTHLSYGQYVSGRRH